MIDDLIGILARIIFGILQWLLFFPIFILVSTPIILIVALFGKSIYRENVKRYYRKVFDWWKKSTGVYPDVFS